LSPILSVVTNIDREHMDTYRNMRDVKNTFLDFMDRVPFYGMIVACNDDPLLRRLLPDVQRRTVTYGTKRGSDFLIKLDSAHRDSGTGSKPMSRFQVSYGKTGEKKNNLGEFTLHVPGVHNILNATAAIAVGVGLDIGVDAIRHALDQFRGVDRRFQLKGQAAGVSVIDDYGHHPTEIKATLAAARSCGFKKVHVIFQPHRYTRTRDLMEDFTTAFNDADTLFVLDIYAASEKPIEGISGQDLAHRIREKTEKHVEYAESFTDAIASSVEAAHDGDMILTLGAGSVSQLGPMILDKLKERDRATGEL
jgi:UDP-N-acetylmuramate--alanine ligase